MSIDDDLTACPIQQQSAIDLHSQLFVQWSLAAALTAATLAVLSGLAIRAPGVDRLNAQVLILALVAILGSFAYTLTQYTATPKYAEEPRLSIEFELNYTDMRGMTA